MTNIERLFNYYKILYSVLNTELLPLRASLGIKRINIYINLDDLIHRIHRPYTEQEFHSSSSNLPREIVANLLNLLAHYRNWASKERMESMVFLVYTTSNIFKNSVRLPLYRNYYNQLTSPTNMDFYTMNKAIASALSVIGVMTKSVHNIYAIDSSYIEPSAVPLYLSRQFPADFNLIVSKSEYDLQYVAYHRWAVIMARGEESKLVTTGNLWEVIRAHNAIEDPIRFHPDLFIWAKTILGDKYRSIPKLTRIGWKTVVRYLKNVSSEDTSEDMLELQLRELRRFIEARKITDTDFNNNLYCTSVKEQVDAFLDSDAAIILHQITDLDDPQSLQEVNKTIFREYPIELHKLLREVPAFVKYNDKTHDDYVWRKLITSASEAARKEKREANE